MFILGISGRAGSGKTTLANILSERYGYAHYSFAKTLKDMVKSAFGLSEEQVNGVEKDTPSRYPARDNPFVRTNGSYYTYRDILIATGQFYRSIDPLFWVSKTLEQILRDGHEYNVISDVRFKNEADSIRDNGGHIVRLQRRTDLLVGNGQLTDVSETQLDSYPLFSLIISADENENMEDMEATAKRLYAEFRRSNLGSII